MSAVEHAPRIDVAFVTRAAFVVNGRWTWARWTHHHGSKYAAILSKAEELGATRWDYTNVFHEEASR